MREHGLQVRFLAQKVAHNFVVPPAVHAVEMSPRRMPRDSRYRRHASSCTGMESTITPSRSKISASPAAS